MKKRRILATALSILMISSVTVALAACDNSDDSGSDSSSTQSNVLTAPTDFTFNTETGEYSFKDNDANAGYYFVRCYKIVNGAEESTYTVSSSRINGGTTGTKSGTIDVSGFGWGEYSIKLVTFAASGSGYTAPDPVTLKAQYGIGGVLEKPEMMVTTEGNTLEVVIDWYTLNDYYIYQTMPEVAINVYSDSALTNVVMTDTVDLSELLDTIDVHPAGGYIWGYDNSALHLNLQGSYGYLYDLYTYTLSAGTYYVTVQALAPADYIGASQVSDAIEITLTDAEATGASYESKTTNLWTEPGQMGVPCAMTSQDTSNRVDYAGAQTVTSKIVSE